MDVIEDVAIPLPENPSIVQLGPKNRAAITRMANYVQKVINAHRPLPQSPFCEWAADRVTGRDKQDLILFIQGRRGSGKSYSALWIAIRLAKAIAKRKGGDWRDYFSIKNCLTLENTDTIMALLKESKKNQVIVVDDCSLAISNRAWNSPENRNFNALLSICRTNRWILILTAPLKKHVDNQTRDLCDITATVEYSFHSGGFNVLKVTKSHIGGKGKEYVNRLMFNGKKIDFWVTCRPEDEELLAEYDRVRDTSVGDIVRSIVETGSFKTPKAKTSKSRSADDNRDKIIAEKGDAILKSLQENPNISNNKLAARHGVSYQVMERVRTKIEEGLKNEEVH